MAVQRYNGGKHWANWNECLSDHVIFAGQWLKIYDGYVGPNRVSPVMVEGIMVSMNSVNNCVF